ncbi:MAG TPA: GTPase [Planctomycetota bacterium]|nr:GTPase [Planctomycetota bacterium]
MNRNEGADSPLCAHIALVGAPHAGKATTLRYLAGALSAWGDVRLATLRTDDDRIYTLEASPADLASAAGRPVRLRLVACTGPVAREGTLRQLESAADAFLFVVDGAPDAASRGLVAHGAFRRRLAAAGRDLDATPIVYQYNKRDLADAIPTAELARAFNRSGRPSAETVAADGRGVVAAFAVAARAALDAMRARDGALAPSADLGDLAARRLATLKPGAA